MKLHNLNLSTLETLLFLWEWVLIVRLHARLHTEYLVTQNEPRSGMTTMQTTETNTDEINCYQATITPSRFLLSILLKDKYTLSFTLSFKEKKKKRISLTLSIFTWCKLWTSNSYTIIWLWDQLLEKSAHENTRSQSFCRGGLNSVIYMDLLSTKAGFNSRDSAAATAADGATKE